MESCIILTIVLHCDVLKCKSEYAAIRRGIGRIDRYGNGIFKKAADAEGTEGAVSVSYTHLTLPTTSRV